MNVNQSLTWSVDGDLGNVVGDPSDALDHNELTCMTTKQHLHAWWAVDFQRDVEIIWFHVVTGGSESRSYREHMHVAVLYFNTYSKSYDT